MFSITQKGKELDKSKYNWDETTKTLSTNENNLVIDFSDYSYCTFKTGYNCTFNTGYNCTFNTGADCTFTTGSYCIFTTGYNCTFTTGSYCIFTTGADCTFKTGKNCVAIRYDVKGIIEIPKDITIKFNGYGISGYTVIEEKKEVTKETCNGKVVEIDGKKYKLQEIA